MSAKKKVKASSSSKKKFTWVDLRRELKAYEKELWDAHELKMKKLYGKDEDGMLDRLNQWLDNKLASNRIESAVDMRKENLIVKYGLVENSKHR